jgi:hypothetical protein
MAPLWNEEKGEEHCPDIGESAAGEDHEIGFQAAIHSWGTFTLQYYGKMGG